MEDIVIFGSSGHSKVVIDILKEQKKYNILGIYVDTEDDQSKWISGYKVLGKIDGNFICSKGIVAIGDNFGRMKVVQRILEFNEDFKFVNAIHPSSVISNNVHLGSGIVVVAGVIINSSVVIGNHSVINTSSSIDHDVVIGEFSSLAPGTTIGGKTKIGNLTTIALGANVIQNISIGNGVLIGAGATVVNDIPNEVMALGLPAKVIRTRKKNEKFL